MPDRMSGLIRIQTVSHCHCFPEEKKNSKKNDFEKNQQRTKVLSADINLCKHLDPDQA